MLACVLRGVISQYPSLPLLCVILSAVVSVEAVGEFVFPGEEICSGSERPAQVRESKQPYFSYLFWKCSHFSCFFLTTLVLNLQLTNSEGHLQPLVHLGHHVNGCSLPVKWMLPTGQGPLYYSMVVVDLCSSHSVNVVLSAFRAVIKSHSLFQSVMSLLVSSSVNLLHKAWQV